MENKVIATRRGGNALSFIVGPQQQGRRLDQYLCSLMPEYSRSYLQKIIRDGDVLVDGISGKPHTLLKKGMSVSVRLPDVEKSDIEPEDIPITVVYEDDHLAVIDKPAGLVVHPGAGRTSGTLVAALLFLGMRLASDAGEDRPGIVHRLDKDTSGLLVVAKDDAAYRSLKEQFSLHTTQRVYRGICWGRIGANSGMIDNPIGRHDRERKRMSIKTRAGREALTEFSVIERFGSMTFAEFRLGTGRTHQIRVHMASRGYPIVGDRTYGSMRALGGLTNRRLKDAAAAMGRQALHAAVLGFLHPAMNTWMSFESALPEDITALLEVLRDEG